VLGDDVHALLPAADSPTHEAPMQHIITCPHCHTSSNHGVHVCVGCHADVHYGVPKEARTAVFIAAVAGGLFAGSRLQFTAGWVVGGVTLVTGLWLMHHIFCDRVVFKRMYRTRQE